MITQDVNIYKDIKDVAIADEAQTNKQFVLNYYQTIPRYYLLCNEQNVNSIVYNYSVGSGKTAAGLFAALDNIDVYKKYQFIVPFFKSTSNDIRVDKNVIVIGSWVSTTAVVNELMKEEFGIVDKREIKRYKKLINSNITDERKQGEAIKRQIYKKIESYIEFYGYQKFVNLCFPHLNKLDINQNVNILKTAYINNELVIAKDFQNRLKNCIILVDECQKLYSNNEMNSYGFAIMCVVKLAQQLNIKLVFLSGTIFNNSIAELVPFVNIISEHTESKYDDYNTPKGLFDNDDCLTKTELIDGYTTMIPTKKFINVAVKLLSNRYVYYNYTQSIGAEQHKGTLYNQDNKPIKSCQSTVSKDILTLKYAKIENLPIEQHIGNICVIDDVNKNVNMLLYSCEVYGYQKQLYKQFLDKNKNNIDMEQDENENILSIHDAGLPPNKELLTHGIVKNGTNYIGKFLHIENIKQYSTIGYNLIKLCTEKTTKGEKVIVYHNKLNNFGIYQYMLILGANGFVKYGESAKNNSICLHCGKTMDKHELDLPKRLELGVCNEFHPIYYYYLIGSMKQTERDYLVANVFNNPKNLYGELLSIMFVSDVAYSGVSFLNTNNIIILSKISNVSKWRQIFARIIRFKSHVMLPTDKQYANVYTMVIHYPNEQTVFNTTFTYEQKYYVIKTKLNESIDNFIKDFHKKSIGYKLFNEPDKITTTENEQMKLIEMYTNDIKTNMDTILKHYIKHFPSSIWTLDTLIKRIKDNRQSYTYLNLSKLSDDFVIKILSNTKGIHFFNYVSDAQKTIYVYVDTKEKPIITPYITFSYDAIEQIPTDKTILYKLFDNLKNAVFLIHKRTYMTKILKFIKKDFSLLVNQKAWWDAVYDTYNEYYDTDEEYFIDNHYSKHRDISKVAGFYYNDIIVLKDGTTKQINYKFPNYDGWDDIPYKFRISSIALTATAPWYLHVNISKKTTNENNKKVSKGITCYSFNHKELYKYLHIDKNKYDNKNEMCMMLIQILIDKQYKNMNDRNLYTPFEK